MNGLRLVGLNRFGNVVFERESLSREVLFDCCYVGIVCPSSNSSAEVALDGFHLWTTLEILCIAEFALWWGHVKPTATRRITTTKMRFSSIDYNKSSIYTWNISGFVLLFKAEVCHFCATWRDLTQLQFDFQFPQVQNVNYFKIIYPGICERS